MTAKYQQIALNDIFSDFQSKLIDNYPLSLFFFQNTLISMNLFHPSSIRPSGFSKVPDTSLLSRFKHNFDAYIELMFQRMVDHTEPICQLIHVSLSQTSIVIPLSIHSTTQLETEIDGIKYVVEIFQSTPPHRWRPSLHDVRKFFLSFQSTPPHRWRRIQPIISYRYYSFNPLHHTGGDSGCVRVYL